MKKIQNVMTALALGNHSKGIFDYATMLAEQLNAKLIIANVINERDINTVGCITNMGYDVDGEHYISNVRKEREQTCRQLIENAGFPPEKAKIVVKTGHPVSTLIDICNEEQADMIVMGPKGRTGLEHILIGSVAEKLFRHSPVTIVSYRPRS